MARIRLFPHARTPSLGELLGSSQAVHQISRQHTIRIARDPFAPFNTAEFQAKRRAGSHVGPIQVARLLGRLLG
jgi:hypothetical protein